MQQIKKASFIAFDDAFFEFLGPQPRMEVAHAFAPDEAKNVHEAPVYVAETNELVFSDTSVLGWLYALNVDNFDVSACSFRLHFGVACIDSSSTDAVRTRYARSRLSLP